MTVQADVSDPAQVAAMVQSVEADLGPVDLLVANAGIGEPVPHTKLTYDIWKRTMAVNVDGVFLSVMAVKDGMWNAGTGGSCAPRRSRTVQSADDDRLRGLQGGGDRHRPQFFGGSGARGGGSRGGAGASRTRTCGGRGSGLAAIGDRQHADAAHGHGRRNGADDPVPAVRPVEFLHPGQTMVASGGRITLP